MQAKAGLSLDTLVQLDWEVVLGGEALSRQELEALARQKGTLVRLRGQWVQLDAREIEAALDFWKRHEGKPQRARDVMRMAWERTPRRAGWRSRASRRAAGWENCCGRCRTAARCSPFRAGELRSHLAPLPAARLRLAALSDPVGTGRVSGRRHGTGQDCRPRSPSWRAGGRRATGVPSWSSARPRSSATGTGRRRGSRPTCRSWCIMAWAEAGTRPSQRKPASTPSCCPASPCCTATWNTCKAVEWAGLVLDEAQNIKNPETRSPKPPARWRRAGASRSPARPSRTMSATSGRSWTSSTPACWAARPSSGALLRAHPERTATRTPPNA